MSRVSIWMILTVVISLGCNDGIDKDGVWSYGEVTGTVAYTGDMVVKEVGVALFKASDYPPTTVAPVATHVIHGEAGASISFPVTFRIDGLSTGDYFMEVYGDVDIDDTLHGPNKLLDPYAQNIGPISIRVDQTWATAQAVLLDPLPESDVVEPSDSTEDAPHDGGVDLATPPEVLTPADVTVAPQTGKAALYGTVAWDGEPEGTLTILGFSTSPPSGAPVLVKYIKNPKFPQFYSIDDVKAGTYHLIVYLDVILTDGMTNQPVDPVSSGFRAVALQAGDAALEDFWLTLP